MAPIFVNSPLRWIPVFEAISPQVRIYIEFQPDNFDGEYTYTGSHNTFGDRLFGHGMFHEVIHHVYQRAVLLEDRPLQIGPGAAIGYLQDAFEFGLATEFL